MLFSHQAYDRRNCVALIELPTRRFRSSSDIVTLLLCFNVYFELPVNRHFTALLYKFCIAFCHTVSYILHI